MQGGVLCLGAQKLVTTGHSAATAATASRDGWEEMVLIIASVWLFHDSGMINCRLSELGLCLCNILKT